MAGQPRSTMVAPDNQGPAKAARAIIHDMKSHPGVTCRWCRARNSLPIICNLQIDAVLGAGQADQDAARAAVLHRIINGFLGYAIKMRGGGRVASDLLRAVLAGT